jgi:hypothetical protein
VPALEEVVHPPHYLQLGVLNEVRGINPRPQARIEAARNEGMQVRPVAD